VIRPDEKKVLLFGCPLDGDEKHEAIEEKLANANKLSGFPDDPLVPLLAALSRVVPEDSWRLGGSIEVPIWVRPTAPQGASAEILLGTAIDFIDRNGCREYAGKIRDYVTSEILPDFPCLIAVDHSLTGGAIAALARHYGKENISLIILDSHTDAVPMPLLSGAIAYDMDTNPGSVYDRSDPFLFNRTDSYNASSFLHHLMEEGLLDPRDLYILGVSDVPDKRAFRIKDPRIADYAGIWTTLHQRGATLITKKDCQLKPGKIKTLLQKIRTPYVYVSIDMDIGARNAVEGVRFKNWQGLSEGQIYRLIDTIHEAGGKQLQLLGMDITEINFRKAGLNSLLGRDQTYEIAANIIRKIAFN
jgi:arginase family enzyme